MFILCLHPLQKTLTLIFFVLFILLELAKSSSHWVCYLFALIYFGGVLILFTYISSVIPNFSPNNISLTLPLAISLTLPLVNTQNLRDSFERFNSTELPLNFITSISSFYFLFFILAIVLLLLILRVRILRDFKSPLRNI